MTFPAFLKNKKQKVKRKTGKQFRANGKGASNLRKRGYPMIEPKNASK